MQKIHRDIIDLIKVAITGENVIINDSLDIESIIEIAIKHQILPCIAEGLYQSKNFSNANIKDMLWKSILRDQNQLYELMQIEKSFEQQGIDYILLKGSSLKELYPKSEFRLMGDIDILIKEAQYDKIKTIMRDLGFEEGKETDHELIWLKKPFTYIELHKKLIPSYNDDYYSYFSDCWSRAIQVASTHRYAMPHEDEYIFLFTHLAKHYRDGGIGLRHLIDFWMIQKKYPNLDYKYINRELKKISLKIFHDNIISTLKVWFSHADSNELTDHITERVIESGSYGIKEKCNAANAARVSNRADNVSVASRKEALKLIFLPFSHMKIKYPILKKIPILLPIMWVVRWLEAIFLKRKNMQEAYNRWMSITEETVLSYNQELERVGLMFDLKK